MLLTITYRGKNTQDLGYLLHKNPHRAQQFELAWGKAYVFYPELSDESTTAAMLLDIDPILLARGKQGSKEGGIFDYVNDRPYVASSFMSNAISRVFGTAMGGRCDKRPELASQKLDLTAVVYNLKDNGSTALAGGLFEPLGYEVATKREILDETFPEWGDSPYVTLTIRGSVALSELLNHLYVLIPVFDRQKHYYTDEGEIEKLLSHGEGWLASHPAKELIAARYLSAKRSYARRAIDTLLSADPDSAPDGSEQAEKTEEAQSPENAELRRRKESLNTMRMNAVRDAVLASGAESVIDLGCGEGRLTSMLLDEKQIKTVAACDVSVSALEKAASRLKTDSMPEYRRRKLTLMQASLTYRDKRFAGYDCACVVEVIEHIEPMRIPAFERAVFEFAAPKTVVLTTPNKEYNAHYRSLTNGELRHGDHRFEWTREEFADWARHICETFGYSVKISCIGDVDPSFGSPTQMGVFTKNE